MTESLIPALQLVGLVERFDDKITAAGLDLVLPHVSFFGLVGPNGAGKTTHVIPGVG